MPDIRAIENPPARALWTAKTRTEIAPLSAHRLSFLALTARKAAAAKTATNNISIKKIFPLNESSKSSETKTRHEEIPRPSPIARKLLMKRLARLRR
jgi:hypothetical protein